MKYAWIENEKIRDICLGDPNECYHPDFAKFYDTQVPDEANNGDGWVNGVLEKAQPLPEIIMPRFYSVDDFRNVMTLAEKVTWDNELLPEIVTVKTELPKEKENLQELVNLLVTVNAISQVTADKILALN